MLTFEEIGSGICRLLSREPNGKLKVNDNSQLLICHEQFIRGLKFSPLSFLSTSFLLRYFVLPLID